LSPELAWLVLPRMPANEYGLTGTSEVYDKKGEGPSWAAEVASARRWEMRQTRRVVYPGDPPLPNQEICRADLDPVRTRTQKASRLSVCVMVENGIARLEAVAILQVGTSMPLVCFSSSRLRDQYADAVREGWISD
jgi:hypothetical protein